MQWFNHILIAGATTAVLDPTLIPVAILGATAPDWLEQGAKQFNYPLIHRGPTHYFSIWLSMWVAMIYLDPSGLLSAFFYGGFSHVLLDAMTITGVPFSPLSDRRFHLFGGRFRTGDSTEYLISFSIVLISFAIILTDQSQHWSPYFMHWGQLYQAGIIDAEEWRQNRFHFF